MARAREPRNLFYAPLLLAGVAFCITAFAYGMLLVRAGRGDVDAAAGGLLEFLDRHGLRLLGWELGLLAAATVGVLGVDRWRERRQAAAPRADSEAQPRTESRSQSP